MKIEFALFHTDLWKSYITAFTDFSYLAYFVKPIYRSEC